MISPAPSAVAICYQFAGYIDGVSRNGAAVIEVDVYRFVQFGVDGHELFGRDRSSGECVEAAEQGERRTSNVERRTLKSFVYD